MPENGCMVWKQWWKATRLLFPGDAAEAKVPATDVRRIAANLEITSAKFATLTGKMHHWENMPKPEFAKVEDLELQVRFLMTRVETK